ncbi:UNVERIFIED_CONTAM: hypothetical protein RMT77_009596 [Armadillidium vulgare]
MDNQEPEEINKDIALGNILHHIAVGNQEIFYENLLQSINHKKERDNEHKIENVQVVCRKSAPIWEEFCRDEKEKLKISFPKNIKESKFLETEKEKMIQELHLYTNKYSNATRENEIMVCRNEKIESDLIKTEGLVSEIEKLLHENSNLLKYLESSVDKYSKMEKVKLVNEIEATRKAQNLLLHSEKKSYEDLSDKLKLIQQKESATIKEILMKEIRVLDIEDEINYFDQKTNTLKSKIQREREENSVLQKLDKKRNSDIKATVEVTFSVAEIHRKLQLTSEDI